MSSRFLHVSEWINRTAAAVYDYAHDPANLVQWAQGWVDRWSLVASDLAALKAVLERRSAQAQPAE